MHSLAFAQQLTDVLEDWSNFVENDENWDTVYLDFPKAFDSVPMKDCQKGICLWYKRNFAVLDQRFLTERRQHVSVQGESSSWKEVISGVPQGSVLGPVLFIIYINDLPDIVSSTVKIFSDETKLYNKDRNCDIIQQDLDALFVWSAQ